MANDEHLKIFRQGVKVWNRWREDNPEIKPDFALAYVSLLDLSGINLKATYFRQTCFYNCILTGADLRTAYLTSTSFIDTDLSYANLSSTYLLYTTFIKSRLRGAIIELAKFEDTVISDTDLTNVVGLDTCRHYGPSAIDYGTLVKSGKLPLNFLRGCGLPDRLIEYLPSLLNDPIQFYSCFISYSSKDHRFAERLYADLQNNGVRCWLASEDLKIGEKIRIRIDESIRIHDKLLLVLSKHSIDSDWVEQEVETALDRERKEKRTVLFPIRLDDTVMKIDTGWPALIKNTRYIGDFRKWRNPEAYEKAFDRLLRDLKAEDQKA